MDMTNDELRELVAMQTRTITEMQARIGALILAKTEAETRAAHLADLHVVQSAAAAAAAAPVVTVDTPEFRIALLRVCAEEVAFAAAAGTASQYDGFERASNARKALLDHIAAAVAQATKEATQHADNAEGMAECMRMFRDDMIGAGVIGESVPPMFISEAILGAIGAKQAEIDRLMLEYCPAEMSAEQMATWEASQRRSPDAAPQQHAQAAQFPEKGGDIFDLIREWAHLPEGQRGDVARNIIGYVNRSYMAGVNDTRVLIAAEKEAKRERLHAKGAAVGDAPYSIGPVDDSRVTGNAQAVQSKQKLYRFDVLDQRGAVLAEGIGVHAEGMQEAEKKARKMLKPGERDIRFKTNAPCHPVRKCAICSARPDLIGATALPNDGSEPDWTAYARAESDAQAALSDEQIITIKKSAVNSWNNRADSMNQWDELGRHEQDMLFARAILATRQRASVASAPAVAVPVVTDEMAMAVRHYDVFNILPDAALKVVAKDIFKAMLALAPQPAAAPVAAAVAQGESDSFNCAEFWAGEAVCPNCGESHRYVGQPQADAASPLTAKKSDERYAQGYGDGWKEGREAMGAALGQDAAALEIFDSGPWRWSETGQNFTGAELDAEAFTQYKPVIEAARQQGRAAGIEEAAKFVEPALDMTDDELTQFGKERRALAADIRALNK